MLWLAVAFLPLALGAGFSCKDQHNFDVPWFAAYKMPKMSGEAAGTSDGHGFYYLDSADRSAFKPSAVAISEDHQAIGYTLAQYYGNKDNDDVLHVLYNDEPASPFASALLQNLTNDPRAVEFGHTKGVVLFDSASTNGIWLIHSVPKFPDEDSYGWPDNAIEYAQSFLCLTLSGDELALVGSALFYNHPHVYAKNSPLWASLASPDLGKVLDGKYNTDLLDTSLHKTLKVIGNEVNAPSFDLFAKSHLFEDDLWQAAVAPIVGSLEVETWRRGYEIDTDCLNPNPVYDAHTMKVGNTDEFKSSKDHAKIGRTIAGGSKGRVCIGDINRMTSQFKRGGGAVCVLDDQLWNAYNVFKTITSC